MRFASGLACGRRRGYDATLRLVRDTEVKLRSSTVWRRILFLSVVIEKRTIEHENSVSQRSLHSLTVLIDFDKPTRPEILVSNLSIRHFCQIERLFDRVLEAPLRAYEGTRSFAASVLVASLQGQSRSASVLGVSPRSYSKLRSDHT